MIFTREAWQVDCGWLAYRVTKGPISYQGFLNWKKSHFSDPIFKTLHEKHLIS